MSGFAGEKKWSPLAKHVFRELRAHMINNQNVYHHPKAAEIPKTHWKTIAHNAAWIAAMIVHDFKKD